MKLKHGIIGMQIFCIVQLLPFLVYGQTAATVSEEDLPVIEKHKTGQQIETIEAIVRGFYIETKVGGGFALMESEINVTNPDPEAPKRKIDVAEELTTGSFVNFSLGYDITDVFAIQMVGGSTLVSSDNTKQVFDLRMAYGGLGARVAPVALSDRFFLFGTGNILYLNASNDIQQSEKGAAVLLTTGMDYFVHIRHFAVGMELSVLIPFNPMRVFLGLGPQLKYVF